MHDSVRDETCSAGGINAIDHKKGGCAGIDIYKIIILKLCRTICGDLFLLKRIFRFLGSDIRFLRDKLPVGKRCAAVYLINVALFLKVLLNPA